MPEISSPPILELERARLEAGRVLFAGACDFMLGVVKTEHMPHGRLPEIAFCGRSNVGKSSLVNALTGRKTLARTSNTPGRTQQLNFFNLADALILVDLPGYGFAKAPKAQVDGWTRLILDYLKGRRELTRAMLLIDARHGLKDKDRDVMKTLDAAAVTYQIVLTKADKVKAAALAHTADEVKAEASTHVAAYPEIVVTSSESGDGIAELRAVLAEIAARR
jgi:GTP-binding protein